MVPLSYIPSSQVEVRPRPSLSVVVYLEIGGNNEAAPVGTRRCTPKLYRMAEQA